MSTSAPTLERWFAEEVQPHEPSLRGYLHGSFPKVRDVDDVVQESYLRLWRARARESVSSAKALLFHIARGVALDNGRRERISPITFDSELAATIAVEDGAPNAADSLCSREEYTLLADAIRSLPRRCREIVIMRKLERLPQKEIARRLGISEQTVQVQVLNGVRRCGAYLARHGVQERPRQ